MGILIRSKFILVFTAVLSISISAQGRTCSEYFQIRNLQNALESFMRPRIELEAWDLAEAGVIRTQEQASEAKMDILSREGTYPILITRQGELVYSHRLPDIQADPSGRYLGTHRGLYNLYNNQKGFQPDIIFAGEIRVIGGKVYSISDMSGSFHFKVMDLGKTANYSDLIRANARRLEYAKRFLLDWGIADSSTTTRNYRERNQPDAPYRLLDSHASAKDVADFELKCFASLSCWSKFTKINDFVIEMTAMGGDQFYRDSFKALKGRIQLEDMDSITILATILTEGVLEFMMKPKVIEDGRDQLFVDSLPRLRELYDMPKVGSVSRESELQ